MLLTTVLVLVIIPLAVEGLECYTCRNVSSLVTCNSMSLCQPGEICHSEFSTVGGERRYTLGCKSGASCPPGTTVGSGSSTIVGHSVVSAQDDHCSECCETGLCNRQLCQNADPECVDKSECVAIGSFSNICVQVDHIKNICKRFCGLCNLVDGGWSQWSTWSACDSTCENGTMTRTRMCNNPAPANGGATCTGNQHENEACSTNKSCPVPGGWSQWSSWGSCSSSCDIGMQRRDRSCSQPYPSYGGDSCFGDGRDDRLCLPGPCADGKWSSWGAWDGCSRSCDGGLRTRSRNCDNPSPSIVGKYCVGDPSQSAICNMSPCQDADWSPWGSWGSCSRSCDGGVRTRTRNCDNPRPSIVGTSCPGNGLDSAICNVAPCQGPVVFFAKDLATISPGANAALIFTHVKTNVGNAYNSRTGFFVAPVNGTYSLHVQFCVVPLKSAQVGLYINDVQYQSFNSYGYNSECRAFSVTALLKQGDKVHVKTDSDTHAGKIFLEASVRMSSFSGALVMRF